VELFATGTGFDFTVDGTTYHAKTKLLGRAAVENIMLAITLCVQMGMTGEEIARGVEKLDYIPHRLQLIESAGAYILDDGYNASETSAKEAVAALKRFDGEKIVVTPGIVETGVLEEEINGKLGELLVGLDMVILVGDTLVGAVKNGYISAGGDVEKLQIVPTLDGAKEILRERLVAGGCVLFLNDLPDVY
jgi:UDP-N-acetylmuramoyl-tripeptide--D-alanyl-D-alanine ligase